MLLLSEGAGGEELSDEVEGSPVGIDPRSVELDDGLMIEILQEVNLRVESLQLIRRAENIVELHLAPSHLHPKHFVECSVHRLHRSFAQDLPKL